MKAIEALLTSHRDRYAERLAVVSKAIDLGPVNGNGTLAALQQSAAFYRDVLAVVEKHRGIHGMAS